MPAANNITKPRVRKVASGRKPTKGQPCPAAQTALTRDTTSDGVQGDGATLQQLREVDKLKVANLIQQVCYRALQWLVQRVDTALGLFSVAMQMQVVQLGSRVKELELSGRESHDARAPSDECVQLKHQLGFAVQLLKRYQTATIRPAQTMPPSNAPTAAEVDAFVSICFGMGVPDWVSKPDAPCVDQHHRGTAANATAAGDVAASKEQVLNSDGDCMGTPADSGCAAEPSVPQVLIPCFQMLLLCTNLETHFMYLC